MEGNDECPKGYLVISTQRAKQTPSCLILKVQTCRQLAKLCSSQLRADDPIETAVLGNERLWHVTVTNQCRVRRDSCD